MNHFPRQLRLDPHHYPGALVTFCGVDGSGKTSLIGRLEQACIDAGFRCLRTCTPTSRIRRDPLFRSLVDDPHSGRVDVLGLLLSIMGDLVQHVADTIAPALQRGEIVLCDRYVFTSQAEICARSDLRKTEPVLAAIAEQLIQPDLAFGLDVSSETSFQRVRARNDASDQPPPISFLERQVAAYRAVYAANRLVTLDSERGLEDTFGLLMDHVRGIARLDSAGFAPSIPSTPAASSRIAFRIDPLTVIANESGVTLS